MHHLRGDAVITAVCVAVAATLLPHTAMAQDPRQAEPSPELQELLTPQFEAREQDTAPAEAPSPPPAGSLPPAETRISALSVFQQTFDATGQPLQATPDVAAGAVAVRDLPPVLSESLEQELQRWLGAPIRQDVVADLQQVIGNALTTHGLPFHLVVVPEQDVSNGQISLVVVLGRAESIKVEGTRYFSEQHYRHLIQQPIGGIIDKPALDADLAWINRNNFRNARISTASGSRIGQTALTLNVNESRPWRVFSSWSNNGTDNTGLARLGIGASHGNAFGLGHSILFQHTFDSEHRRSVSEYLSWNVPLNRWRQELRTSLSYSKLDIALPSSVSNEGESQNASFSWVFPALDVAAADSREWRLGMEYARSDNNLLFAQQVVTDTVTETWQLVGGVSGQRRLTRTRLDYGVDLAYSPGGVTADNDDAAFAATRALAQASYLLIRPQLGLSWTLGSGWLLTSRLTGQWADENQLGAQQLSIGGRYGVRGYAESSFFADQGALLRSEFHAPAWRWSGPLAPGMVDAYAFFDRAWGAPVNRLPGERDLNPSGFGLGVNLQISRHANAAVQYAAAASEKRLIDDDDQWYLSLNLSW